jgi:phytoene synthase
MMAYIMEARAQETVARACDLGVAMQLTNIARDVGEDARAGRLYLPTTWLLDVGIDPGEWLRKPECSPALQGVVARLLESADRLYERASEGIAMLPRDCRLGIRVARTLYCDIGHQLRRAGCDSVSRRTVVPMSRKMALVLRTLLDSRPVDERLEWLLNLFARLERRDRESMTGAS